MYELLAEIVTHLRMVWRRRWVAWAATTLIAMAGVVYVLALPDTYNVTAKVYVDTQSMLGPALRGLVLHTGAGRQAVELMRRTLLVRANMEEIARATDMDLAAKTPEDMERLLDDLKDDIGVGQTRNTNIFNIAYESSDPQLAKRVVDALLNLFVERSLGEARKGSTVTQEFLQNQIKEYEVKLVAAEDRMKEFKRQNLALMPGAGESYFGRRNALQETLAAARLELQEAEKRRAALEEQLNNPDDPALWMDPKAEIDPLEDKIRRLEESLYDLLLHYTERHPEVIRTRRLMADLEAQKQALLDPESGEESPVRNIDNPVFHGLKVAMSEADAQVAALQARVAQYEAQDEELARLVEASLKVEAEFKRLNRDYSVHQANYKQLVSRREQAEMTYEADQTGDQLQMRVIEPARVPLFPTGPNRPLLSMLVLLLGLGAGVGLAWLTSQLRPVFFEARQIGDLLNLPVLGSVSMKSVGGELARSHRQVLGFTVASAAMLVVYVGLVVFQPIDRELLAGVLELPRTFL